MPDLNKFIKLTPELYDYVIAHGNNEDPVRRELSEETAKLGPISRMEIATEQGTFMGMLVRAAGVKSAVEVGTFTGYSALCVARGLPSNGKLLCCDINEQWTAIAKKYWEKAGIAHKIELKLGPALDTLRAMPEVHCFDFAFIDADKVNYRNYYEEILKRLSQSGLILFDNVLWGGEVLNQNDTSEDTRAIRELNDFIAQDKRVETVMLPIADGLTIARKR